jgi:hypothetical protein
VILLGDLGDVDNLVHEDDAPHASGGAHGRSDGLRLHLLAFHFFLIRKVPRRRFTIH